MLRIVKPPYQAITATIRTQISHAQVLMLATPGRGRIVYFAHSKLDYCTSRAAKVRSLVREHRPDARLLDPSRFGQTWNDLAERFGSQDAVYQFVVGCADEVVALEHEGFVGRGVFTELEIANQRGLPRFVVRGGKLVPVDSIELFNQNDFKRCYGRVFVNGDHTHGAA